MKKPNKKPVAIKASTIWEVIAKAKKAQEEFDALPAKERAARLKAQAEILAKLGPGGPTAIMITKK